MLNELHEAAQALERHGIRPPATHPDVGSVGKADCLLIQISADGMPKSLRLLSKPETALLWRHSKGNHNSFPAIRVQKPLLAESESKKVDMHTWDKLKLSDKLALLRSLDFTAVNPQTDDIKVSDWTMQKLAQVMDSQAPELDALKRLLTVFPKAGQGGPFYAALLKRIQEELEVCDSKNLADFLKKLLVGETAGKNKEKYASKCLTYYDIYETMEVPCKVTSQATATALIRLLSKARQTEEGEQGGLPCALTGAIGKNVDDKYPNPNLPMIGLTYLYSRKADIPCLARYGMNGTDAFHANKEAVSAMNDALAFLTLPERYRVTWKGMGDSNQDKKNLLLAFLADDPANEALLAQLLDDPTDYDELEGTYENLCKQVLGKLKDVLRKNPQSKINLMILEALDVGRKQIVYANSITAQRLVDNMFSWNEASQNIPDIRFPVWEKTGKEKGSAAAGQAGKAKNEKKVTHYYPLCPGPEEICQLLKVYYRRSGGSVTVKKLKQSGASLHEIYSLYMPRSDAERSNTDLPNHFIQLVPTKCKFLLADLGEDLTRYYALLPSMAREGRIKNVQLAVSLLSILLWRLEIRKENYMLNTPFNVGQFLQLADLLHKEYCTQVRNGGDKHKPLPNQLMGNELLTITSENPVEGLNRLRERMKIYLAWARSLPTGEKSIAKWILARYGEVCGKIASNDLPEQFDSVQQAQVLLGYLAAIPYEK